MAKIKITDVVERELKDFLEENGLELYLCEYVKEGKDWYLRVFVDKIGDNISIDECEIVSRYLSERLDELDPIEKNYYLEVSSPGMDRPLFKDEHFERYKGEIIDITLYKAIDGSKQYTGKLNGLADGNILIEDEEGNTMEIPREAASKVRLAVIF